MKVWTVARNDGDVNGVETKNRSRKEKGRGRLRCE